VNDEKKSEEGERRERWRREVLAPLKERFGERREVFTTLSGVEVQDIYGPSDIEGRSYEERLGYPGEFPYTRGVQPNMYRGRLWTMRQYAGFGDAREANERFRYLLDQGQTGLSVAFDLPTQMGLDSDHPRSEGEVGRTGVAIDSLEDAARLFEGIPLDRVSTSMTINATAAILLCMYVAVAERQGVEPKALRGTIQNDILKEYVARGCYIYPPEPSLRLITDIFAYCGEHLPRFNTISVSGYHIREAGSNAVQELAFTLADGLCYLEAARKAGLDVTAMARQVSFFFNAHNNFFEEAAKFRAARRLWATLLRERFGVEDPAALRLRFHTQTAGCTLTAQQPENNVVRVTLQALAAVMGGTQSLHTNSQDEALALPTEETARLALRTQQIIAHESGVADFVDPLGGSYAVEALTDEMERRAREYIERVDEMGGMIKAIETGFVQNEIHESAYAYQRAVEAKERVVVGVNEYTEGAEGARALHRIDPQVMEAQAARLGRLREERDEERVRAALGAVEQAARGTENLVPSILEAVKALATLGEISDTLKGVFGGYRSP